MGLKIKYQIIGWLSAVSSLLAIELEVSLGNAFNADQSLSIIKDGETINFDASFNTNGFQSPQYYSIRVIKQLKNRNIEFEMIHHKLYVEENLPDRVSRFEVTDGYNFLLFNLSSKIRQKFFYRLGIGTVVSHPYIIVDGETNYMRGGGLIPKFWSDGYHWDGISAQISTFYKNNFNDRWSYNLETKLIYAQSTIPIEGGEVTVPNTSIHFLFGLSRKLKG